MEIIPIQITVADWPTYIKVCQDNLDFSPTRGLDEAKIDIKKPAAFLYTLDLANQPHQAIQRRELYAHCFASFIGIMDGEIICEIAKKLREVAITSRVGQYRNDVAVFSADLAVWEYVITSYSIKDTGKYIREFLNIIMRHLGRAGYNEIWAMYDEYPQADGTFTLKGK